MVEAMLQCQALHHAYPSKLGPPAVAIEEITFSVPKGEIVCIVGPSGCGKSTLLRLVSGLMSPTSGEVLFHGAHVGGVPDGLATVFQAYARSLFPWLRVGQNVEFPLRRRLGKRERRARAQSALKAVGIAEHTHKFPWELSGGMQQRVAIARALAVEPDLLLMDEPFASVDAQTRSELEDLLLELQARLHITVVVVTHDIDESVYLADHVVALTRAPSRVARTIAVDLPRPRDQIGTKQLPEFLARRAEVFELLHADQPERDES